MDTDFAIRKRVAELGRELTPLTEIVEQTGVSRGTAERWLLSEGMEPVLKRGERRVTRAGSLRNTPLALSIEDGVRRRVEQLGRKDGA